MRLLHLFARRVSSGAFLVAIGGAFVTACGGDRAVLTQLVEARRLASELHVQFTLAAEASNRAVMADTDDASSAAAAEARRARQTVERDTQTLAAALTSLGYADDTRFLEQFTSRFDEYRRLDDEILPLAVENTNLKAQRLSFGPSRQAAESFRTSVDAAVRAGAQQDACRAQALALRARVALLEIQAMYAPHIAEADDAAMTRMEGEMAAAATAARSALAELRKTLTPAAARELDVADATFDRFMSVHGELIALSRRNSDVRSLALSLGRKRTVTAECDAHLQELELALTKHEFTATR